MKITILSRSALDELLTRGIDKDSAIICFHSSKDGEEAKPAVLKQQDIPVFSVAVPDIDLQILEDWGYTYETYLQESDALAAFIYEAKAEDRHLICQCDYGQSRSAACAAAILQHFEGRGIDVFADYRYYPNQLVYHKVFDALQKYAACR